MLLAFLKNNKAEKKRHKNTRTEYCVAELCAQVDLAIASKSSVTKTKTNGASLSDNAEVEAHLFSLISLATRPTAPTLAQELGVELYWIRGTDVSKTPTSRLISRVG
jgi:hypothetical protein